MSIKALPPSTVRIIGSSQVLTDPASVVKELVDNALDARATSIFIEISLNTIDVVQVRDNGHGIAPDDRALVCRRYCTSKIREYADLKNIGGKWLGFRGEALASAAELSSSILITTRVDGEDVAVAMKLNTRGEIEQQEKASHPVGTTVRVNDIFKHLPVRKQSALKVSTKSLSRIKRLLQAYALARPLTRFSLRVLKAKNDKANWMYAPGSNATVEDAAFKVVGKECASQCDWMVLDTDGFEVQAFLPRSTADVSKISNIGSFFFVDSRPVSTSRGLLKQIITMFRDRLRSCNTSASTGNAKDMFIWLNIVCSPQSYDANIEPAKDDVLFEDGSKVLGAVEKLMDQAYPQPAAPAFIEVFEDPETPSTRGEIPLPKYSSTWNGNDDDVNPVVVEDIARDNIESTSGLKDINVSNPWIMAKMHSSSRPRRTNSLRNGHQVVPLQERGDSDANSTAAIEAVFPPHPPWMLPTPDASSSPLREGRTEIDEPILVHALDLHSVSPRPQVSHMPEVLGIPSAEAEDSCPQNQRKQYKGWKAVNDFVPAGELPLSTPFSTRISGITLPETSPTLETTPPPLSKPPNRRALKPFAGVNKPFISPVQHDLRVWFDDPGASSTTKTISRQERGMHQDIDSQHVLTAAEEAGMEASRGKRRRQNPVDTDADNEMLEDTDVEVIGPLQSTLDEFLNGRHSAVPAEDGHPQIRTYHHTPPDIASTTQETPNPPATTHIHARDISPLLHDSLPNSRLHIQHPTNPQTSTITHEPQLAEVPNPPQRSARGPSRTTSRTARLPLERVPAGAELHNLLTTVSLSLTMLSTSLQCFLRSDECFPMRQGGDGTVGARGWGVTASVDLDADGCDGETSPNYIAATGFDHPPPADADVDMWSARIDEWLRSLQVEETVGGSAVSELYDADAAAIRPALFNALNARQQHGVTASEATSSAAVGG